MIPISSFGLIIMTKISTFTAIALFKLLSLLPIRLLRWFGGRIGTLLWLINSRSRQVTEENLAICFPDMATAKRTALAKNSLKHLAMTGLELAPIWQRPVPLLIKTIADIEGLQILQQALADDNGLIVLAPHIGSWELVGLYLAEQASITTMYQPPDNKAIEYVMIRARSRNGSKLVATDSSGVKALLQTLKKGEMIGVLPDQVPPMAGGGFAPFFATPALTTTLIRKLAKRTGATVIMASALRINHSGKFRLVFTAVPETICADDELLALSVLNQTVEQCVALAPEQYQWEYKRFKKQPAGSRKYYQNNN